MWMVVFDFIFMGSADLLGLKMERKIQNQSICLQADSNARPACLESNPVFLNTRTRWLDVHLSCYFLHIKLN